jgi:hypothetical protein
MYYANYVNNNKVQALFTYERIVCDMHYMQLNT